jgi:peptidyl-prolyl cis-trans isomerase C
LEKKKEFLDNLVEFELLALEAKSKGYDKDPDVVFAMKQQMIKKLMKEDLSDLVKLSDVTDEEMRAFYDQNAELYHKPEQVRASGIVLADKAKAEQVLAELTKAIEDNPRRKRQTFNDFVRDKSADEASARRNGDLGFFTTKGDAEEPAKDVPETVAATAFGLERINDLSSVVEADGKYWILMLTNRRPKVDKSFDEVKRQIQNKLFRDAKEGARERYLADLRKKANVTTHDENLALVKNPDVHEQMMPGLGLPQGGGPGPDKAEGMQRQIEMMRKKAEEKAHDHQH